MLLFLGASLAGPEVILKLESKVGTACSKFPAIYAYMGRG